MATTTNFGWSKPTVGGNAGAWGTLLNALVDAIDSKLYSRTRTTEFTELGSVSTSAAMDFDDGNAWNATVGGAVTFSMANVPSGAVVGGVLRLVNGGSATVTWPSSFKWPGGAAPTLTSSGVDLITFVSFDGGATFLALANLDMS